MSKQEVPIYVGRHFNGLLKKSPCPGRGSNRGPFDLRSSTLPRHYKSRLVPWKDVSVGISAYITNQVIPENWTKVYPTTDTRKVICHRRDKSIIINQ